MIVASHSVISRIDKADFLDFAGQAIFKRCVSAHGVLSLGECYGFFPALAMVGIESPMRKVENIRKVKTLEYFSILAQIQTLHLAKVGPTGIEIVREIGLRSEQCI